MTNEHLPSCDCYDCNHLNKEDIGYYLDGILAAQMPTNLWSNAGVKKGGKVIRTYKVGEQIGRIFSWVKDANGAVWFMLVDPSTPQDKVNNAKIIGYTPYLPNQFNKDLVYKTSSGKKLDDELKAIQNMPIFDWKKGFDFLGLGNLKWYILAVIVLIVILKFKK